MFGQYKRLTNRYEADVLTGKGLAYGGSRARKEATDSGRRTLSSACWRGAVTGSKASAPWFPAPAMWPSTPVRQREKGAHFVESGTIWDVPCQIAMPSATQNELTGRDAHTLIANGVLAVGEGANMPSTPEAIRAFQEAGVLFAPGKAANAGGVATSALEMQQNASRDSWTFAETEARLAEIMNNIHDVCADTAEEYGVPNDYVLGANIAGFERVAAAMQALGII
jgi:glutamate dehydrogenase (NADP+)